MEKRINALLLKFPGTNCDEETARALRTTGFDVVVIPFSLVEPLHLREADLVVLSGGFSYGDYVMAGRLAQLEVEERLGASLCDFRERGGFLLGICNGFQILMRLGLLPQGSLIANSNGRFVCKWVTLEKKNELNPFLKKLPARFELPIAHAEGRFVTEDRKAETNAAEGLAALRYTEDVNGSVCSIAGLQDAGGQVFGLMPHPERFLYKEDHYDPDWDGDDQWGWGYYFFKSIFESIAK